VPKKALVTGGSKVERPVNVREHTYTTSQTHHHAASDWRIHRVVEVTDSSTNKQHSLSARGEVCRRRSRVPAAESVRVRRKEAVIARAGPETVTVSVGARGKRARNYRERGSERAWSVGSNQQRRKPLSHRWR
jgi:hypothetical protein